MTQSVQPVESAQPAVMPVVDYEPPVGVTSARPIRRRRCRGRGRPPSEHPPPARRTPLPGAVAGFADATLRRVLEVIDRRRPAAHLYPLLAAGLVDSLLPGSLAGPAMGPASSQSRPAPAALQRLRLQPIGPVRAPTAVEVAGTYRRGRRVHALACRIERATSEAGWRVVALHIG